MKNFYPFFIEEKFQQNIFKGKIKGTVLFADMSGFTNMTETLMKQGKVGAEILSQILNTIFEPVIESVYKNNGFISTFAGDAFIAIFPEEINSFPLKTAFEIQEILKEKGQYNFEDYVFDISMKIGLGYGSIKWGIPGKDELYSYFFRGKAIDRAVECEKTAKKKEIICHKSFFDKFKPQILNFKKITKDFFKIETIKSEPVLSETFLCFNNKNTYLNFDKFYPKEIKNRDTIGEFRDVVSVFISFKNPEKFEVLSTFIGNVRNLLKKYGGYFNSLDFADKGAFIYIQFGAPVSYENNLERALDFLFTLKISSKINFKSGITKGTVFSGYEGSKIMASYTSLGDRVNLAARIVESAKFGEIRIPTKTINNYKELYKTKEIGEFKFKGKEKSVEISIVKKKIEDNMPLSFVTEFFGREKELKHLRHLIKKQISNKKEKIIYVFGDVGVGKSRFVFESIKKYEQKTVFIVLQSDSVIKKSMNLFSNFFKTFLSATSQNNLDLLGVFEKNWNDFISQINETKHPEKEAVFKELIRTKSLIFSLAGIDLKNSLYEKLDAKGKFENTIYAIVAFFKAYSIIKPEIVVVEDFQWCDEDSKTVLATLIKNLTNFPVSFVFVSRFTDSGEKPKLFENIQKIDTTEIILEKLTKQETLNYVTHLLNALPSPELMELIEEKTSFNPFYIEQIVFYLKENDFLIKKENQFFLVADKLDIPDKIKSVIISRIDRLSSKLKNIVFSASAIGQEIDVRILEKIVKNNHLQTLLNEGKKEQLWIDESKITYLFKHGILRDLAYEMQLISRLKKLHNTIAKTMEQLYAKDKTKFADIAFHYERAENYKKSAYFFELAGDFSAKHFRNTEAVHFYKKVLKYCSKKTIISNVYHKTAKIYRLIGEWKNSEDFYRKSLDIFVKSLLKKAEIMTDLGQLLVEKGEYEKAKKLFDDSLKIYKRKKYQKGESLVMGYIGLIYYYQGKITKAREFFENKLSIATKIKDSAELMLANRYLGGIEYYLGNYKNMLKPYEKSLKYAKQLKNEIFIAIATGNLGLAYSYTNKLNKALDFYNKSLEIYEKYGDKYGIAYTFSNMGEIYLWKGEYDKALYNFSEQLKISNELENHRFKALALNFLGIVHKATNQFEKSEQYFEDAINFAKKYNLENLICEFLYEQAKLFQMQNKIEYSIKSAKHSQTIAKKVERRDYLFKSKLLIAELTKDEKQSLEILENLKSMVQNEEEKAEYYFSHFKLTQEEISRKKAIKIFEKLYKQAPKISYKQKITALQQKQ